MIVIMKARTSTLVAVVSIVIIALGTTACGSSSSSSSTHTQSTAASKTTTSTTATTSTSTATANSGATGIAAVTTGPVRATLRGANHDPLVKAPWHYSVTATDAAGHPLSGTVDVQFVFGGQVVGRDTPPTHPLTNGHWHDNLNFPAQSIGIPLTFQVVAHTPDGTVTLNWPVKVRK
jgi:Special lobe-specific silk protein SSP160